MCINWVIRPSQVPRVFSSLGSNHFGRPIAWRFFSDHYDDFVKVLGEGTNLLLNSIRALAERISTRRDYDELRQFLDSKDFGKNQERIQQMYEQIELNCQWRRLNEEKLGAWLVDWDERRRRVHRGKKQLKSSRGKKMEEE